MLCKGSRSFLHGRLPRRVRSVAILGRMPAWLGWRKSDVAAELAPPTELALSDALSASDSEAVARLLALREQIARRARDCGRAPEEVKLVAVAKTFSADEVWPTIAIAGQTRFGENRVQEAVPKWRDLRARAGAIGSNI